MSIFSGVRMATIWLKLGTLFRYDGMMIVSEDKRRGRSEGGGLFVTFLHVTGMEWMCRWETKVKSMNLGRKG